MQCYGSLAHSMMLKRTLVPLDQVRSGTSTLRVLQWNVLADGLSQHGGFAKVIHYTLTCGRHGSRCRPIKDLNVLLKQYDHIATCQFLPLHGTRNQLLWLLRRTHRF